MSLPTDPKADVFTPVRDAQTAKRLERVSFDADQAQLENLVNEQRELQATDAHAIEEQRVRASEAVFWGEDPKLTDAELRANASRTRKLAALGDAIKLAEIQAAETREITTESDEPVRAAVVAIACDANRSAVAEVQAKLAATIEPLAQLVATDHVLAGWTNGRLVLPGGVSIPVRGDMVAKQFIERTPHALRPSGFSIEAVRTRAATITRAFNTAITTEEG